MSDLIEVLAKVLAAHIRGDWSDRTYSCSGCRQRFEEASQERWEAMTGDDERRAHQAELGRYMKPDWTLADYNAHVAEEAAKALGTAGLVPIYPLCKRCGEPPKGSFVDLETGGFMHTDPCWYAALDEAEEADRG